jgi:hypothetical protein
MNVQAQINNYISSLTAIKSSEMQVLHNLLLELMPSCKLWYLDGKNSDGKVIANPNIGYGSYNIQYADGTTKEFYQIGLSAITIGISVYIMNLKDKTYLDKTYSKLLGKARITGYCIKFKTIKDINLKILAIAILDGLAVQNK